MPGKFSEIAHVNERFLELIAYCGANPYSPTPRAKMTVVDIVERIKFEMGEKAIRSIKVTFH